MPERSPQPSPLLSREEVAKLLTVSPLGLYILGLLSVQAHLLRYGIFDASLLEFYYIVVGGWLVISLLPAALVVGFLAAAFGRKRQAGTRGRHRRRRPATVLGGLAIAFLIGLWAFNYSALSLAVNLNCYPFPIDYLRFNLVCANTFLIVIGALAILLSRDPTRRREVTVISLVFLLVFFAVYGLIFGRTIYPAIDPGFGGGAPQLGTISLGGEEPIPVILLFSSKTGRYFLKLERLPEKVADRDGYYYYLDREDSPVFKATFYGPVHFAPNARVTAITIFAPKQPKKYREAIQRRLTEG